MWARKGRKHAGLCVRCGARTSQVQLLHVTSCKPPPLHSVGLHWVLGMDYNTPTTATLIRHPICSHQGRAIPSHLPQFPPTKRPTHSRPAPTPSAAPSHCC